MDTSVPWYPLCVLCVDGVILSFGPCVSSHAFLSFLLPTPLHNYLAGISWLLIYRTENYQKLKGLIDGITSKRT